MILFSLVILLVVVVLSSALNIEGVLNGPLGCSESVNLVSILLEDLQMSTIGAVLFYFGFSDRTYFELGVSRPCF